MSGNGNQVPLAPSQRGPGPYPRASTPHRPVECYHPSGAAGAAYMPGSSGGAQSSAQASLRVQPTPQPTAPPAPQQDMSKTTMAGHNYVSQNQTPQPRPQYSNFQYRPTQHGSRPNTHPRQQQPYIPAATATTGPVMYPALVFQPTHMGMQTYQQPRSSGPGFFQYVGHPYIGYNTPPNHSTPYYGYPSNSPQLPTPSLQSNAAGGRNNSTTLVGPQGTPANPTATAASLPHAQAPTHMHQTMPGIRPAVQKRSKRVPIIDPITRQEVLSDLYTNDSSFLSAETNDRQTPQPEATHSIAEEFNRMVNEVANQHCENTIKSNYVPKNVNVEMPLSTPSSVQPQINAINSINNNIVKSEILNVNENKSLGPDIAVEPNETPIVSAISDSPVIVPKMPMIIKQQKSCEQNVQSLVLDTNKNIPITKQHKSKNVPHVDEVEKSSDNLVSAAPVSHAPSLTPMNAAAVVSMATSSFVSVPAPAPAPAPSPSSSSAPTFVPAPVSASAPAHAPGAMLVTALAPQPQRIREPRERVKSEEKEKHYKDVQERETYRHNGPLSPIAISSVDSLSELINPITRQNHPHQAADTSKKQIPIKYTSSTLESVLSSLSIEKRIEPTIKSEPATVPSSLTATELLSASIEKFAKEPLVSETIPEVKEVSSAIEAQAKLTQSISSVFRNNQPDFKMKDINLNSKTSDPDTANGNPTEVAKSETPKEDINKNEKALKNSKNNNKKSGNKMANSEVNVKESELHENGKNETDKVVNVEQDKTPKQETAAKAASVEKQPAPASAPFVPKYKYSDEQWSPLNKSGKKCYDIGLLKQIKEDPMSKNKPDVPLLETLNVIRNTPLQEPLFNFQRPTSESLLLPSFAQGSGKSGSRNNAPNAKKDGRNMAPSGKGSVKLTPAASGSSSHNKQTIYMSLSLREEVKLNEVDSAWKPTRFRKDNVVEDDFKTQDLYKKFRGILNKLTPQKFDTLMEKVKTLEINNQKRLEGVIDLVFEKAIDEPNFSEAYAGMCNKLSMLQVPADNATSPDQYVNFRGLIVNRCQQQFVTNKVDEQVLKLEKELAECTDQAKKKELQLMLEEENRRVRMRSVGNVRFIGELYKLKMLTLKIMDFCMRHLIDKLEEEKLECLCKLLTTIGEQIENEPNGPLDNIFKKMQDIVDRKSNKISSRVKFMIQDVILLRRRKWVPKSVVDSQPKMMDQIQKEAEQAQRQIELMNASPMGFRRDDGGRGKRGGDNRRQNSNNPYSDNNWKTRSNYLQPVDTSKFKAVTQKNLSNIKLAPPTWNHGAKNTAPTANSNSMISLSKNMYSMLETTQADPSSLRTNRDMMPNYSKGASIERSTFNSRGDFSSGASSRSGSMVARSNSGTRSSSGAPATPPAAPDATAIEPEPTSVPQEPLPDNKKNSVKTTIDLCLINNDNAEMVHDVKQLFPPQYHAAVVSEILNVALEKSADKVALIAKSLLHLVCTKTISANNFLEGIKEILEIAPDLYIDIPMLYDFLGKFIAPHIEKKHITFTQVFRISDSIISANQGHLFLKAVIIELNESMGPTFVTSKWQEAEMQLNKWMKEDLVPKWIEDNKFEFLDGGAMSCEETKKILNPAQTQSRLLQLMNLDENCDCIRAWVQDKFGKASNEDWFMRALIQAICEYALFFPEGRNAPHFNQDRMNKYAGLIHEFGETKEAREASCLFGIQQLIHRLEHPQGLTLVIFQYLHEQYIISLQGFIEWEKSEMEPEGKGVMMKALTSFFTNIKEADNDDSSEE